MTAERAVIKWRDVRRSKCMPFSREAVDQTTARRVGLVYWDAETKPAAWRWAAGKLRSRDQYTDIHEACAACEAVLKGAP